MDGLKPPYLVLSNHLAFMDFYVTPMALFPFRANYVSEIESFRAFGEWICRQVGCLGTRKFVNDLALPRNIKRIMEQKGIIVLYPEARYANVGTNSHLPESLGKLVKMLKVPVVTINMKGNYLQSPIWNVKRRKGVFLEADIEQLYTREELINSPLNEVCEKIQTALTYDEYARQYEKKIEIRDTWRAEGLELVLYQCPHCLTEFQIVTKGAELSCLYCQSQWFLTVHGRLKLISNPSFTTSADIKTTEEKTDQTNKNTDRFAAIAHTQEWHIPDWYEWEREQIIQKIEKNEYILTTKVRIESLPNAKNSINLGEGYLRHDANGFELTFSDSDETNLSLIKDPALKEYFYKKPSAIHSGSFIKKKTLSFPPASMTSIHTEYNYLRKGQCVTLSTLDNTYFLYPLLPPADSRPEEAFNATKIQFATEYLYEQLKKNNQPSTQR